jgi:hypothetical protein
VKNGRAVSFGNGYVFFAVPAYKAFPECDKNGLRIPAVAAILETSNLQEKSANDAAALLLKGDSRA